MKYIEENGSISNKEAREILGLADLTTKRISMKNTGKYEQIEDEAY